VQTELVDVSSGTQLWGEQYNRKLSDLLAVQDEISREISEKLRLRLTGEEKARLASARAVNPDAYQLYLQGRFYWNRRTEEGLKKALDYMNQAAAKDANYALVYAGLADCYVVMADHRWMQATEAYPKAKTAAQRALELDPTLAGPHSALALIREDYDLDWSGAEAEYKRAIELNPNYATGHQWYGLSLMSLGRRDEARQQIELARGLDPLSLQIQTNFGDLYRDAHEFDRAIEQYRKVVEMDPNFANVRFHLGDAYREKGMYREAAAEWQKAWLLENDREGAAAWENVIDEASFRRAAARDLAHLKELSKKQYVSPMNLASSALDGQDKEQALAWLEEAYREHASGLIYLKMAPAFDPLRSDPRFQDLLRRLHFPP